MVTNSVILLLGGLCMVGAGFALGWLGNLRLGKKHLSAARSEARDLLRDTRGEAEKLKRQSMLQAREEWQQTRIRLEADLKGRVRTVQKQQQSLEDRDRHLQQRLEEVRKQAEKAQEAERKLQATQAEAAENRERFRRLREETNRKLEQIAGLSVEEAKKMLLNNLKAETRFEAARMIREIKDEAQRNADAEAGKIIALAIERLASEVTSAKSVTSIPIPGAKVKGRIIGYEGKNIRAFEKATGVQLLMDETPDTLVLSCFNPIKREIARVSLERLLKDGNIHPRRIEEVVEKSRRKVEESIQRAGEETVRDLGIKGMHQGMVHTLGRLKYRTSYGQNVLDHSIEVAKLTAMMATELGLDATLALRAGLLHDIGKAIDFEREGTHPEIGAEVGTRYGEHEVVINAIASHHDDIEVTSPISVLVGAADAISGSRPGARRKTLVDYAKRIEKLEGIANSYEGVEQSYAIQAGREIRVIAMPEKIDDAQVSLLANDLAQRIQKEMEYPGRIKVTVIREMRATEVAR
ncbi:MAG TPA: ribonuclease Y [Candidatus Polarisedimenticolia bacterium]|nr:ribonuclease Y [Candidatus Polarisedimenticolia bacterium]